MKTRESDIKNQKNAIRSNIRRRLLTLSDSSKETFSKKITEYFVALGILHTLKSLFIYISQPSEVSTHHLIKTALEAEVKVYAPKIINNHMIAQRLLAVNDLIPGKWGISEPPTTTYSPTHIDLVITPGLAFTKAGMRLGRGAGFYDQWLSNNSYGNAIALAYNMTILENLPVSTHDIQVDRIVTEICCINCHTHREDV
jgi:5-formyltetrahydrofolate cyclo-ligase